MSKKVLLIEDNIMISKSIEQKLKEEMYDVKAVYNGKEAISAFNQNDFDIVLLDLMLPIISGEEVLKTIRTISEVPVMIISTKDTDVEKAVNLGLGADDYMVKPFSMLELLARVKALLRRTKQQEHLQIKKAYRFLDMHINLETYQATKNNVDIDLTAKEFEILALFLSHPNQTFSKQEIYRRIWNEEYYANDNVINVHMRRLRKKIEDDPANPVIIKTVWGIGYKLGNINFI